jgi:hypothetical protein
MLYSYRHPDVAAKQSEAPKLSETEAAGLVERRRFVRSIPVPAAEESTEADVWSLWDQASEVKPAAE